MIDITTNFIQNTNSETFELTMLLASFIGGVIASISPCSLGMLPIIIGYVGGYTKDNPLITFFKMLLFVIGMSFVFTVIGIICAVSGKVFSSVLGSYFGLIIGSLLIVMGLKLMDILDFEFPVLVKVFPKNEGGFVYIYPLLAGIVFALAGTPCSTPILAGIMAFASVMKNLPIAILMLFLFSLGQGIILIIAGVFTSSIKNLRSFSKISNSLMKFSGVLLIIAGLYIFYKIFSYLL